MKSGNPGLCIGLVFILMVGCLIGFTALSVTWRSSSWPVVLYLLEYSLVQVLFGAVVGALYAGFLGRGKGFLSNISGVILIIVFLALNALIYLALFEDAPKNLSVLERTVRTISFWLGTGGAVMEGSAITRWFSLKKAGVSFKPPPGR